MTLIGTRTQDCDRLPVWVLLTHQIRGDSLLLVDPEVRPIPQGVPSIGQRTGRRPKRRFPDPNSTGQDRESRDRRDDSRPDANDPDRGSRGSRDDHHPDHHRIDILVRGQILPDRQGPSGRLRPVSVSGCSQRVRGAR